MIKKAAAALLSAVLLISLAGCADYRALNQQTIVAGIAVDLSRANPDSFSFLFEIINTAGMDISESMSTGFIRAEGATLSQALAAADNQIYSKLLFINTELVVISGEAAGEKGIGWIATEIFGNYRIRDTAAVAVSRDCRAEELFLPGNEGQTGQQIVSYEMYRYLKEGQPGTSSAHIIRIYELFNELEQEDGSAVLLPAFTLEKGGNGNDMPGPGGLGIISGGLLAGYIDEQYTPAVMQAGERFRTGSHFTVPGEKGGVITLIINSVSARHRFTNKNGKLTLFIDITAQADIMAPPVLDAANTADTAEKIGELAENYLRGCLEYIYRQAAEEYSADPLGLSRTIYRNDPELWRRLEPEWQRLLEQSELEVNARFRVRSDGKEM